MVHRIKKENDMHAGKWNGLGGKLENGETPEECAIREIYEESGLWVKDLHLKGIITFPAFDGEDRTGLRHKASLVSRSTWRRAQKLGLSGAFLYISIESMISCFASSMPYQPSTRTHLPSSRSL